MSIEVRELLEFAAPAKVDRLESGAIVVRRVKYLGARSSNVNKDGTQNVYTLEARENSQELYEGAKVYVDHPDRATPGITRSVRDQLGWLSGPFEHTEDGSYADLYLNPKHELAENVAWVAERRPSQLGLSHNAQGTGRVDGKDCRVEAIKRVRSVDVVSDAATTKGLLEGQDSTEEPVGTKAKLIAALEAADEKKLLEMVDEEALIKILSDDTLYGDQKANKALALIASAYAAAMPKDTQEGAAELAPAKGGTRTPATPVEAQESATQPAAGDRPRDSRDELFEAMKEQFATQQAELAALKEREETRERHARRRKLLEASRLPKRNGHVIGALFEASVLDAETDERAEALIEEHKALVFHQPVTGSGGRPPASGASSDPQINTVDDLVGRLA